MATAYNVKSNYGPGHNGSGTSQFTSSGGVNYASVYAKAIDERFKHKSRVEPALNKDFQFEGVNSVTVLSIDTVPLENYQPSGFNRFGDLKELGNGEQTLTIKQDKSFTFAIDRRSALSTNGMVAATALKRELDEVVVPSYDKYVLQKLYDAANGYNPTSGVGANVITPSAAVTKDTAFHEFMQIQDVMENANVPVENITVFMDTRYYTMLKESGFVLDSENGMNIHHSGNLGDVDGAKVIRIPTGYMPKDTNGNSLNVLAIAIASNLVIAPKKLEYYKMHVDPVGVNGWVVEGRVIYDCFVLNNKLPAIYVLRQYTGS